MFPLFERPMRGRLDSSYCYPMAVGDVWPGGGQCEAVLEAYSDSVVGRGLQGVYHG